MQDRPRVWLFGVLLALPVAAVANVLLRYAHERYLESRLYAGQSPAVIVQVTPSIVSAGSVDATTGEGDA